jgi:hypothetical protein
VFGISYVWMCTSLAPEPSEGYSLFKSSSILDRSLMNINIPLPETWDLQMGPKNQDGNSVDNHSNLFFLSSMAFCELWLPSQLANNCKSFATIIFMG